MKNLLHLLTLFACATATSVYGQIELKLELATDGTYTAIARSQTNLLPPLDHVTHTAQVVVTVPTGGFDLASLNSHAGQWQLTSLVQRPVENPSLDYALFSLSTATDAINYPAGQEVPLFSFRNALGCTGQFDLMHPSSDPFLPPNSLGLPVFSEFIIEGAGSVNAVSGRYGDGQANCFKTTNCLINCELEVLSDNFYQISLTTDAAFSAPGPLNFAQVSIRVPTNFFQIYNLTNLLPSHFSFGNTSRQDAPMEDAGHDFITFRMNSVGAGFDLLPGTKTPILRFANRGSCQGDSIFLVKNNDPFLPPNSQSANLGHVLHFGSSPENIPICPGTMAAAPCLGCLFTDGLVKLDSVQATDPVVCLGGMNGTLRLFAHGAPNLQYSVDGGQNWSNNPHFTGLGVGSYLPQVRGLRFGCMATTTGQPVELQPGTNLVVKLEAPTAACEGEDVQFKIMSPSPLPAQANLIWSGPQGFGAGFANPVVFDVNNYQSGDYTLLLEAPGCDPAVATTHLQVNPLPTVPDLLTNGPICFGDKVKLFTTAKASVFDWYGPFGAALPALTTTDSVVYIDQTMDVYASGNWQLKITDEHGCSAMSTPVASLIKPRPQAFAETGGPTCPGGTAQLFSNPLPNATYEWRRQGEPTIFSTQANPLINNVLAAQTYTLLVWQDGCVSSVAALATVSINQPPTIAPQHQYIPATDCAPKPLTLSANAGGIGLSYLWSGPNGFSSQAANPVIAAASSPANGSYTVQVSNVFGCSATESVLVAGIPDPVAQPQVQGSGPACPGDDLTLSVQPYNAQQVSYQWYKGTVPVFGQTSNSLIFNAIQPISEGSYKLRATVDGCVVESVGYAVDVLDKPQPNPDFFLSQPCEGGTLQFYSNSNGISDWRWTGPAGFVSDSPTPVIYQTRLSDIGAYQLTVTGTNGCTAAANVVIDGILANPVAPVVASNSPICPDGEIVLTVQNPSNYGTVEFEWLNGLGEPIGTGQAALVLPVGDSSAVPPFLVKTTVNTCPSAFSDPVQVAVLPNPVALAWHGGAVCEGSAAQLFAASQAGVNYEWLSGGQVVSLEQNPVFYLADTADFQLVVKTNGCSVEATTSVVVPVNPNPVISDLTANLSVCEGSPVNLSATNSAPISGSMQYAWAGPNGYSFTGSAGAMGPFPLAFTSIAPQNEGSYTLTLTSTNGGCVSAPQSVAVEVGQIPATPTVTVTDSQLCEGETLQLDATPTTGNNLGYDWFFNGQWLATTTNPTYLVTGATLSQSGNYFVKTTAGGCESPASNLVPVSIIALPTGALATNPTNSLTPACEGTDVALSATLLPGASYHWYGPLGFFANVPNPVLDGVSGGQAGEYLVVIGYPQCSTTLAFETAVFVSATPQTPVLAGATTACEGEDVVLSIANSEVGASYDFYFGQNGQPLQAVAGELVLTNIGAAQSGAYSASASLNGCESMISAPLNLQIVPAQTGTAFAGDDLTICGATEIPMLQATPPTVGAGQWKALDGATVVQPASAHSSVLGLLPGENRFVWTLTNGICPGVGSDTAVVFLENVKAVEDFFSLPLNDSLLNINLLSNDLKQNLPEWDFTVLTTPTKGRLQEGTDGEVSYFPYPNAFGEDGFRYRLCSMNCPDVCDETTVSISLDGSVVAEDCFRPNLITPDGDGLDDVFVIPCAAGWPGSALLVFNRWGSTVFESKDYQNDWAGTYNGQPLPPGTYFYQLRLNDGEGTVLQGYVVIEN